MILVYVSGPYTRGDIDTNILFTRRVAIELWNEGYYVLTPHLNTAHFEVDCAAKYEDYIAGDIRMLATCDAIVMLPDWEQSAGAQVEKDYAERVGIPVYLWPERPAVSSTLSNCPEQSRAFLETVMKMYRVHLDKNADYSPSNINGTGRVGVSTRMWDKAARLLNLSGLGMEARGEYNNLLALFQRVLVMMRLTGFRIQWAFGKFTGKRPAKNEPLEDAYMDIAVYGIIGLLLRNGKWGR